MCVCVCVCVCVYCPSFKGLHYLRILRSSLPSPIKL